MVGRTTVIVVLQDLVLLDSCTQTNTHRYNTEEKRQESSSYGREYEFLFGIVIKKL